MNLLFKLEELRKLDVISMLEVEFVRFLMSIIPDEKEEVLLAAAACVHAQINGHVCLDIENLKEEYVFNDAKSGIKLTKSIKQQWLQNLEESELVSYGNELKPLVLENGRLYLHRYWKYEEELSDWLRKKSASQNAISEESNKVINSLFPAKADLFETNWQQIAVCLSFLKDLLVISGGPGTGKTYTVLNIITAHMLAHPEQPMRIALAAPTGKAARRLADSIEEGKKNLPEELRSKHEIPTSALTVHKLLGSGYRSSHFRFNEENKLPFDIVIIDEASMLDITMWVRLIRAIGPNTKLVVLGDKDQLASVEAGSILGDVCRGENSFSKPVASSLEQITGSPISVADSKSDIVDSVIFLTKSYRFGENSGIQKFAMAVNNSDDETAIALLNDPKFTDLTWLQPTDENINSVIQEYAVQHYKMYMNEPTDKRLSASNHKKMLCAVRRGRFGVDTLNRLSERVIRDEQQFIKSDEWYPGRIVMSTRNDAMLKVRNGEIGLCDGQEESKIIFEGESSFPVSVARLKNYETAYAITIHKSQGSEFDDVAIILPNKVKSILSKEILYTSVTRARRNTLIIANEKIMRTAIKSSISRNSGLQQKIWGEKS